MTATFAALFRGASHGSAPALHTVAATLERFEGTRRYLAATRVLWKATRAVATLRCTASTTRAMPSPAP